MAKEQQPKDLVEAVRNSHDHPQDSLNRPYPYQSDLLSPPSHPVSLYGITGWISSWYGEDSAEIATAFGGYFKHNPYNNLIVGETTDRWGRAIIEGELSLRDGNFLFSKRYFQLRGNVPQYPIEYSLTRSKQLWIGKFVISHKEEGMAGRTGKVETMLTHFHDHAAGMASYPGESYTPRIVIDRYATNIE